MGGIGPSSLICIDVRPFCSGLSVIGRLDVDVTAPLYKKAVRRVSQVIRSTEQAELS